MREGLSFRGKHRHDLPALVFTNALAQIQDTLTLPCLPLIKIPFLIDVSRNALLVLDLKGMINIRHGMITVLKIVICMCVNL